MMRVPRAGCLHRPLPWRARPDSRRRSVAAWPGRHCGIRVVAVLAREAFATAMRHLAAMRAPLDAFFKAVQVNNDNQTVRRNQLTLLHDIREACLQVADLTRLQG